MAECSPKRSCHRSDDFDCETNIFFKHLYSACIAKFMVMFTHIYDVFTIAHKCETIVLFKRWIDVMNNTFVATDNYFYMIEKELEKRPNVAEYNEDVEKICCAFVMIIGKLYIDDDCVVEDDFTLVSGSEYIRCELYYSKKARIGYNPKHIFLILSNNMKKGLFITRNETIERAPHHYLENMRFLIGEIVWIEKKVVDDLQWHLINPLIMAPINDQSSHKRQHRDRPGADRRKVSSDDKMVQQQCSRRNFSTQACKKRICRRPQESSVHRVCLSI